MVEHSYAVCDLETTGVRISGSEIITGCIIVLDPSMTEIDRMEFKLSVDSWLPRYDGSVEIHGFKPIEVLSFPDKKETLIKIFNFLAGHFVKLGQMHFVCHSRRIGYPLPGVKAMVSYDYAMLKQEFFDLGCKYYYSFIGFFPSPMILNTHSIARYAAEAGAITKNRISRAGKKYPNFSGLSLDQLCLDYNIPLKHHDCVSDAEACVSLLRIFSRLVKFKDVLKSDEVNNDDDDTTEDDLQNRSEGAIQEHSYRSDCGVGRNASIFDF